MRRSVLAEHEGAAMRRRIAVAGQQPFGIDASFAYQSGNEVDEER